MADQSIIEERTNYLLGLLSAARTVIIANADAGVGSYSGAVALLDELERGLRNFAAELKQAE